MFAKLPVPLDPDTLIKREIWEAMLFLERMKTAMREFPPALQKDVEMASLAAAQHELQKVITHVMKTGDQLVAEDPALRG